ncbi:MAG: cytochrome c-type biogenesis protein CcmH [Actinomycetota bacterium]|nr:cytochrome c-type biogenesis protein CcmH [Actinomycetota bacterium]
MSSRKLLPWFALIVVVIVGVVVLVVRSRPDSSPAARAERLEHQLACPVCDGQSIADSNSPQSRAIRDDIPRRIAAGQSDAEIRAFYVSRYTERILETPSNSGLGIVAWGLPALAVILGSASIVVAVRRWSRAPRLTATDADEDIVRRAREDGE